MAGFIHIYCGDGKGKTTAAVGLALRAAGAGKKVIFAQFLKDGSSSEIRLLKEQKGIEVCVCTKPHGFVISMNEAQRKEAKCDFSVLFDRATDVASKGAELLVLDEIISSCNCDMIDEEKLYDFLCNKPENLEVVLTGRDPSTRLLSVADYVTHMQKMKHPYDKGISARKGIEY